MQNALSLFPLPQNTFSNDIKTAFQNRQYTDLCFRLTVSTDDTATEDVWIHKSFFDVDIAAKFLEWYPNQHVIDDNTYTGFDIRAVVVDSITDFKQSVETRVYRCFDNEKLKDVLIRLLETEYAADITINVQSISIKLHKFILAIRCPYFTTLFQSSFADANCRQYTLPADLFENEETRSWLLKYIYTGDTTELATVSDVSKLFNGYESADYLGMESYGRLVIHYLVKLCYLKKDTMSLVLPFCQEFHLTEVYAHIKGIWLDNFESLLLIELLKLDDSMQKDILLEFETKYLNIDNVLSLHTSFKSSLTTSSRNSKLKAILERLIQTVDSRVRSFLPKFLNPKLLHLYLLKPPILEIKDRIDCVSEIVQQSLNDHQKAAKLGFLAWNCHKIINEQDLAVLNTLDELNTAMVNTELGKLSETVLNRLAKNWLNIQLSNGFTNSSSIDQSSWTDFISKIAVKANITVTELMGDDLSQMNQIKTKTGLVVKSKSKDVVSTTSQNTIHSPNVTKKNSRSLIPNQSTRNPNANLSRRLSSHTSRRTATPVFSSTSSLTDIATSPKPSPSISNANSSDSQSDVLSVNHQPHRTLQSPRTPRLSNLHTTSSIPTRIPIPNCTVSRLGITKSFINEDKNAGSKLPKKCNFR